MAMQLQAAFAEEFTDFPVKKEPSYGQENGVVITRTRLIDDGTGHDEKGGPSQMAPTPSLLRGADRSMSRKYGLTVQLSRPDKFPVRAYYSPAWNVQLRNRTE